MSVAKKVFDESFAVTVIGSVTAIVVAGILAKRISQAAPALSGSAPAGSPAPVTVQQTANGLLVTVSKSTPVQIQYV